jgi:hypothetical protein
MICKAIGLGVDDDMQKMAMNAGQRSGLLYLSKEFKQAQSKN